MRKFSNNIKVSKFAKKQKLRTFDKYGRIYFPSFIRGIYAGYYFSIQIENGKIVLDPIKIDDDVFVEEEVEK